MSTRAEMVEAYLSELTSLRQAVALMGFDPKRLAAFIADSSDHACKSILLSSLSLDQNKLRESGATSPERWLGLLDALRPIH